VLNCVGMGAEVHESGFDGPLNVWGITAAGADAGDRLLQATHRLRATDHP